MTLAATAALLLGVSNGARGQADIPSDTRAITHALSRMAFGPRPGEVDRIKKTGLARWIAGQLEPQQIPDTAVSDRLARLATVALEPDVIASEYVRPARDARRRLLAQRQPTGSDTGDAARVGAGDTPGGAARAVAPAIVRGRQVLAELSEAKLLRAIYSERQLEEVLVDFWFNHFNVFARKGPTEIFVAQYEREAIRPHVLGRFRDLLGATAKSPAMLLYLDNWQSVDPAAGARQRRRLQSPAVEGAAVQPPRGLNENYARELLELHTLGADGGYTQPDIVAVARAFTGWTIARPREGGAFRFAPLRHDRTAKTILGRTIPAGGGIEDGERVLDLLASHPSTARHITFKLAQRFVADVPPPALVDRAAIVFQRTHGDLRAVVRTIVTSHEFFADATYRAKVKTPFEFVTSAVRATGADVLRTPALVRALATLGMPLYLCQPPTGYGETADAWLSSGALINRLNLAVSLTAGELRGVRLPVEPGLSADGAGDRVVQNALGGDLSPATRDTIGRARTTAHALALTIGSPEFQRQ